MKKASELVGRSIPNEWKTFEAECPRGECSNRVKWRALWDAEAERRFPASTPICVPCSDADDAEMRRITATDNRGDLTESERFLDDVGVNLTKHGRVTLGTWSRRFDGEAYDAAERWARSVAKAPRKTPPIGVLFHGPTGNGKTQLAVAIARYLHESHNWRSGDVVFDRWGTFLRYLWNEKNPTDYIERRKHVRLWILDDLGDEPPTPATVRTLVEILSERRGTTLATGNLGLDELAHRYADVDGVERLISRLGPREFHPIRFTGPDFREAPRGG